MDDRFEKKQYLVNSTFGVCKVEKITKLVAGKEQQLEYYVLQSVSEPNRRSYVPVENRETVLRVPMDIGRAQELLQELSRGKLLPEENFPDTYEEVKKILEQGEPASWARAVQFRREHKGTLDSDVEEILDKIWKYLREELAFVLKLTRDEVEQQVKEKNEVL